MVFWFTLLLSVAATLAGASLSVGAYESAGDPQTVVRAYFGALRDGDAAAALGYGSVPGGQHDLLTARILAAQNATAPIGNLTVRGVHQNGNAADVDVSYLLQFPGGDTTVLDTIPVIRVGHDWHLAQSAVSLSIDPGDGSTLADFAGAQIPTGDYAMFPGALPVTYTTPNLVLDAVSRVIRFGGDSVLQVNAQVSPAGRKAITPALRAALMACLAGRGAPQPLCPLPDPDEAVPGSLRGTLTKPTNVVDFVVDTADGKIDITEEVPVNASYQQLDVNDLVSQKSIDTVSVRAHCFATQPGTIVWDAS